MSENVFDTINAAPVDEAVAAPATSSAANDEARAKKNEMKQALKHALLDDKTMASRMHTLSESLEVVNSLGYGDKGNIVVDKVKSVDGARVLKSISPCIGYRVRNCGTTPIPYDTEVWTKGEDGRWVGQQVSKVLAPGETADLPRQFMTMLAAQPEFSFKLKNGRISRGSGTKGSKGDLKAELEAHYFAFNREAAEDGKEVNSDEVKLNVGVKDAEGNWSVKPEFAETFGYLENASEKSRGGRKSEGPKYTSGDVAANWINQMIKQQKL